MAGKWPTVALGDVSISHDARRVPVKESERIAGPYPYYGASGVVDFVNSYLFDGDYLLVAEDGENLRTRQTPVAFMASGKFWVNNHAHILEGTQEARTRYLAYAMATADISAYLTGAVMPKLTKANLALIPIPLPTLREQDAIVELLGSLDGKIELNCRIAGTLEEMARAQFKSWFVDFDPVRAKAEGRDAGLPGDTATLFPDSFGEDGLPEGWKLSEIAEFFELVGGGTPKTSVAEYWDGDIPWFSVVDAPSPSAPFIYSTERSISHAGLENCASPLLPEGATIITARGTVGKLGIAGIPMAFNQSCYAALPRANLGAFFVYYVLLDAINELTVRSHGSVFSTITRQTFDGLQRPFGSPELAQAFDKMVTPFMDGVRARIKQSIVLKALRDTLLPKLISGELRIKDAEAAVEAA
jgi:type I restriction enzyme S subunit